MTENEKNALRREGYVTALVEWHVLNPEFANRSALKQFPDRTLRRVPDPREEKWAWVWDADRNCPAVDYMGGGYPERALAHWEVTPERWAIWKDLEANPWETLP